MRNIEFVSYDGKWPCLCLGTLVLEIDGVKHSLKGGLCSGGTCWIDDDYNEHVTEGEWDIDFDYEDWLALNLTDEEKQYIVRLFNENVENGCCGGCI